MTARDEQEEAIIAAEMAAQAGHPTRVAYDRARADFPNGGEEARAAFHVYLREERAKRDAAVADEERMKPRVPSIIEATGVPMCGGIHCPKYAKFQDLCTEDNVDSPTVCIPAVRDMVLEIDAADPAFDEIVKLCGLAKTWEYPGQVVRDVEDALKKRDEETGAARNRIIELTNQLARVEAQIGGIEGNLKNLLESVDEEHTHLGAMAGAEATIGRLRDDLAAVIQQNQKLQAALVYARNRRGARFDFDEWIIQVEHALDNADRAAALEAAVDRVREQHDKIPPHALENAQAVEHKALQAIAGMRAQRDDADKDRAWLRAELRVAEAVRDDARAASARDLELRRHAIALAEREKGRSACPWVGCDPDEGYWHCELELGHTERHVTKSGRGLNDRWYLPCDDHAHTFVGDNCRECGLPVVAKT